MTPGWLVIGVSLASAFAVSSSLQHLSAGQVPDAQDLGADVVGLSLQVLALHLGALAVVQPLLISGLLLTPRESWRSRPTATRRSSTAVTVAGGTDGGSSTSNPIGSTLIRPSSVTQRATSR